MCNPHKSEYSSITSILMVEQDEAYYYFSSDMPSYELNKMKKPSAHVRMTISTQRHGPIQPTDGKLPTRQN